MRKLLNTFLAMTLSAGILGARPGGQESSRNQASQAFSAERSLLNPPSLSEQAPATFKVKFATSKGDFLVQVTRAWAPLGADRFYALVKNHFYDDASFFRVVPGLVVQFGISAQPEVSRVWASATIKDDPVTESNRAGYLTFATAGRNTRSTQLFINLVDNRNLDHMGLAPFGEVIEGMTVVRDLYSGYGEGAPAGHGPDQARITSEGKAYLDKDFPLLDSIRKAVVTPYGQLLLEQEAAWRDFQPKAAAWRALATKPPLSPEADRERLLAENAIKEKNLDSAINHYEGALELQPTWPAGWFNLALLYAEQKNYADATDAMKHYLELVPNAPDAKDAREQMIIWEDKAKH